MSDVSEMMKVEWIGWDNKSHKLQNHGTDIGFCISNLPDQVLTYYDQGKRNRESK